MPKEVNIKVNIHTDVVLRTGNCPSEQYSEQFLQGMIDRVAQAYHKYGLTKNNIEADWLGSVKLRIDKYLETGNKEWLIDASNFIMCEFMYPRKGGTHYRATEAGESPGFIDRDGRRKKSTYQRPPTFHTHEGD